MEKFIVIPPSLIGLSEVEGLLGQWKPIKPYPRSRTYLSYSLAFLVLLALVAFSRGVLSDHTPGLATISVAVLVLMVANLFLLRTLRRIPNLDERSKPKRWRFVLMIVYLLLFVISIAVFFGLKKQDLWGMPGIRAVAGENKAKADIAAMKIPGIAPRDVVKRLAVVIREK